MLPNIVLLGDLNYGTSVFFSVTEQFFLSDRKLFGAI